MEHTTLKFIFNEILHKPKNVDSIKFACGCVYEKDCLHACQEHYKQFIGKKSKKSN